MALGWGGISAVSCATGLSRKAISHGIKELQEEEEGAEGRIRRSGLIRLQIGDQPLSPQVMWEDVRTKINQALYTWHTDAIKRDGSQI